MTEFFDFGDERHIRSPYYQAFAALVWRFDGARDLLEGGAPAAEVRRALESALRALDAWALVRPGN